MEPFDFEVRVKPDVSRIFRLECTYDGTRHYLWARVMHYDPGSGDTRLYSTTFHESAHAAACAEQPKYRFTLPQLFLASELARRLSAELTNNGCREEPTTIPTPTEAVA
jgi:hypothetical protein